MSFDVFFQRIPQPSSGETHEGRLPEALTDAERTAVLDVLVRAGATQPDAHGVRELCLPDGASATVHTARLDETCAFFVRGAGLTPGLLRVLYDVMVTGRWMLFASEVAAVSSADHLDGVPPALIAPFREVAVVRSADELGALLTQGFEAWQAYRDPIVGTSRS